MSQPKNPIYTRLPTKQQQIFLTCYSCQQSQQQCQSDILIDFKCNMFHVCYRCYTKLKNQSMTICPCKMRLKQHIKYKNTRKQHILEEGSKIFQKQKAIRETWSKQLNQEFVNILSYYYRNGRGNQYEVKQKQLKVILKDLKKKENLILVDLQKKNIPLNISIENNDPTGKEACGYVSNYDKGIKFLFQSFGL